MTPKFQDNPTGNEDRVNPIPPRFLPFKDFAIPREDDIYLNYNSNDTIYPWTLCLKYYIFEYK